MTPEDAEVALGWFLSAWAADDRPVEPEERQALAALLSVAEDPDLRRRVRAVLSGGSDVGRRSRRYVEAAEPQRRQGVSASTVAGIVVGAAMFLGGAQLGIFGWSAYAQCRSIVGQIASDLHALDCAPPQTRMIFAGILAIGGLLVMVSAASSSGS